MPRFRLLFTALGLAAVSGAYACSDGNGPVGAPNQSAIDASGGDGGLVFSDGGSDFDAAANDAGLGDPHSLLAVGDGFACVLAKDGTVSCWGRNDLGQLGREPATTPSCGAYPCSPTPQPVAGLSNIVRIAAGDEFACALDTSRQVWCWGSNAAGQLESFAGAMSFSPKKLILDSIDLVAAGTHACVRQSDSIVRCWGEDTCRIFGGSDGEIRRAAAILAGLPKMSQISIGRDALCGISLADGHALCWGADHKGSLGHDMDPAAPKCAGNFPYDPVPKAVQQGTNQFITDIADVHIGYGVGCARHTNGQVLCWGDNTKGALGQGIPDLNPHPRALEVPAVLASKLEIAEQTVCTITAGRLLCWGDSPDGQLELLSPAPACGNQVCRGLGYAVTNMNPIHTFAIGRHAVGAIKNDLSAWMWGNNTSAGLALSQSAPGNQACGSGKCIPAPTELAGLPALN